MKFPTREQVTRAVLRIIQPEYTDADFDFKMITWWLNIRSNGGFGLTYDGSKAFELACIDYKEFETSTPPIIHFALTLDKKMPVAYYSRIDKGICKIKVYDDRVSMMIILYDTIDVYLSHLKSRHK